MNQRDYDIFLQDKIEAARSSMRAGRGVPDEDIEAEFAAWRAEALATGSDPQAPGMDDPIISP